jgi:CrcB protein
MSLVTWAAFVVAAAIGAPARYLADLAVRGRTHGVFPWGTVVVNVTGSFVLGVLTGLGLYHSLPASARVVLGAGFCGAYTTFSTFSFETVRLVEAGEVGAAARNMLATVALGAAAAAAGLAIASV